jgi:hypothetical protein
MTITALRDFNPADVGSGQNPNPPFRSLRQLPPAADMTITALPPCFHQVDDTQSGRDYRG